MVPLSESIGITSTLDQNLVISPTGSPNNLSFAKVIFQNNFIILMYVIIRVRILMTQITKIKYHKNQIQNVSEIKKIILKYH